MDPHLNLANRLYEVIVANLTTLETWGSYLTSPEFDKEPELRNKIGVIWVCSLLDTLEAESRFLPEVAKEAQARDFISLVHNAQQLQKFCVIVGEVLDVFTRGEQIFLVDLRNQWVHTYFANRHRGLIAVKYAARGKVISEKLTERQYFEAMDELWEKAKVSSLDNVLTPLIARALDKKLRYWQVMGILQRDREALYKALREDQKITFRI